MARNEDARAPVDSCMMQQMQHTRRPARGPGGGHGCTLRPACAGDADDVRRLLLDAGLPIAGLGEHFPHGYVVAERAGELGGAAGVEARGDSGLLRSVVVSPALRGAGLGLELVRERIAWSREHGLHDLHLLTTTAADWFARLGFRRSERAAAPASVRESVEFTSACPASAISMRLALDDACEVRARYEALATCCSAVGSSPVTAGLYSEGELRTHAEMPPILSLGCGNPTALAELRPGEVVLDLGSGGGLDVLLSARRVAPGGRAIGLDATEAMVALARTNQARAGVANAEFLLGAIESIPLASGSVDVVLSNCVLNLSTDRPRALAEAWRVLRPGGRLAFADIVALRVLPDDMRREAETWLGCTSGTLDAAVYEALLRATGFASVSLAPTRVYRAEHARALVAEAGRPEPVWLAEVDGAYASAFVRASKPPGTPPPPAASSVHDLGSQP